MGRKRKPRPHHYKNYYDKLGDDEVPESTVRYKKKCRVELPNELDINETLSDSQDSFAVTQTDNSFFALSPLRSGVGLLDSERTKGPDTSSNDDFVDNPEDNREVTREGGCLEDCGIDHASDEDSNSSTPHESVHLASQDNDISDTDDISSNDGFVGEPEDNRQSTHERECLEDCQIYHTSDVDGNSTSDESEELSGQDNDISGTGDISTNNDFLGEPEVNRQLTHEEGRLEDCELDHTSDEGGNSYSTSDESEDLSGQDSDISELSDSLHEENESTGDFNQRGAGGDEDDGNDVHDKDLRHAFQRLKHEMPSLQGKMNLRVNISVGEILINALTLCHKHNWSHLEKEHLMKFTKSIIGNVVPSTRYLLDDYFFTKEDMCYFFYCSVCSFSSGKVPASNDRPQQVQCIRCKTVNVLSDLSQATYFVAFHLPTQIETLLSDPQIRNKLYNPCDFVNPPDDNVMKDLHHGTMYRQLASYVKNNSSPRTRYLSFTISLDSASLCEFSGQKICPCFIQINEFPPVIRMGDPVLAGLWFGRNKEKVDLFLPPLVKHITQLSVNGFTLHFDGEVWYVKAYLISCVADSVARCDIQGIHAHRGDFPCSWCLVEGEEYENVRIFRYNEQRDEPRTLEELLRDSIEAQATKTFVRGVKYLSPLCAAPLFDAVNGLIVDQMHAKDEGTTKSFLKEWLSTSLSENNVKNVNKRLRKLTLPKEVRKSVRSFEDIPYWTGRELENWGLFVSIPVLENILPDRLLKHWALYVQGNYILLCSEIPISSLDIAESLLEEFCSTVENLYNPSMMRFNLHILRHFVANSRRWGPIFALSAYGFEAGIQKLKKHIHNANFIPNQVCRGLSESNALILLKNYCGTVTTQLFEDDIDASARSSVIEIPGKIRLQQKGKPLIPTQEEQWFLQQMDMESSDFTVFPELLKEGCHFGAQVNARKKKTDNSFERLQDNTFIQIMKILYHEPSQKVFIVASRIRCAPSRFCPPSVVRYDTSMCFQYAVSSIDEEIDFFDVYQLKQICVSIKFDHGHYLHPMPNIFNMY